MLLSSIRAAVVTSITSHSFVAAGRPPRLTVDLTVDLPFEWKVKCHRRGENALTGYFINYIMSEIAGFDLTQEGDLTLPRETTWLRHIIVVKNELASERMRTPHIRRSPQNRDSDRTTPPGTRVWVMVAALSLAALLPVVPAMGQTQDDVEEAERAEEEARAALLETQSTLEEAIAEYQRIAGEYYELEDRVARLQARIDSDTGTIEALETDAQELVLLAYMGGGDDPLHAILDSSSMQDLLTTQALQERASEAQASSLNRLVVLRRESERLSEMLQANLETLAGLRFEASRTRDRVDELLHEAQDDYDARVAETDAARHAYADEQRRIAEEEARRRAEEEAKRQPSGGRAGGGSVSGLACPSSTPLSFINDWGFPRSGGRTHQGTDIFAPYGNAVYAVTDGVVRAREGGIGGITIWLNGDDGNGYYYAHLSGWASGVSTGTRVSKGELVGYVGDSGNAKGTPPHTHFQIHPGGGRAVNPYPTLVEICDRG